MRKITRNSFASCCSCFILFNDPGLFYIICVRLNIPIFSQSDAPKKVSLSISPSGDIFKGSSMTLTCSSDANPPVTQSGYSLYKDGHFIGSGQHHNISDVQPSHSGLYHCQAWNNISWRGSDLINSTQVPLDVQCKSSDI